jgi:hypothetical protein
MGPSSGLRIANPTQSDHSTTPTFVTAVQQPEDLGKAKATNGRDDDEEDYPIEALVYGQRLSASNAGGNSYGGEGYGDTGRLSRQSQGGSVRGRYDGSGYDDWA